MRVLNLYAGIGGNRALWPESVQVTAVEFDEKIAAVYKKLYPQDEVIVDDAHEYLRKTIEQDPNKFDFIWSSPPCPTHSKMAKATRHKTRKYPDMKLYEEIIFLQNFYKGHFVVENVKPYYDFLIQPTKIIGRHCFWSSFDFDVEDVKRPTGFIQTSNLAGRKTMQEWLGIHFDEVIYYKKNHCPVQILRNAVHPKIGLGIYSQCVQNLNN